MMIHEKLMSGQFLLDLKNDRSGLLQAAAVAHHQQQPLHHLQPPSPPMPALDIYSAYAYQQQLQQQLLNSAVAPHHMTAANPNPAHTTAEVLDLSRRDSVETPRKTPSPYHTNSSFGTGSPAGSPNGFMPQQQQPQHNSAAALLPANLLYAAQAQQQAQNLNNLQIPANLAALYPGLYYPAAAAVKQEPLSTTPPPSSLPVSQPAPPALANNNLLQTFAAAAAASTLKHDLPEPHSPQQAQTSNNTTATTPTSSTSNLSSQDTKNTRPFKAFPRDPLVIAANFAATDVLLDNPRVERYTEYRKRVLEQIRTSNGGSRTVTNPKMRRTNSASGSIHEGSSSNNSENDERHHEESSDCDSNSGQDSQNAVSSSKSQENSSNNTVTGSGGMVKDAAYYERRRKNNAAAKKSRDRRRIKEDEIAIRAAYLERQNIELLCQIDALKAQLAALTSKMS
ncbi:Protein giant [Lucilia cuprina]|uniref:Protein giant n=1 Tax=Lucilia cuprina TaxID=7375 RepID=A0A0L0CUG4_LUCCU|nr:Protein giant [Lucilia cuprina]